MKLSKKVAKIQSLGFFEPSPMLLGLYFKMHRDASGKVDLVEKWDIEEPDFLQLSRNGGDWNYFPIVWSKFKGV